MLVGFIILPCVGLMIFATKFKIVDLPQPLGHIKTLILPGNMNGQSIPISTGSMLADSSGNVVVDGTNTTGIPSTYQGQTLTKYTPPVYLPTSYTAFRTALSNIGVTYSSIQYLYFKDSDISGGAGTTGTFIDGISYAKPDDVSLILYSPSIMVFPINSSRYFNG